MKTTPNQITHTPGPWIDAKDGRILAGPYDRDGRPATLVASGVPEGNRRLVTAAPDLLRQLKATLAAFKECVGADAWREFEENNSAVVCAQCAIIEAEGRA